MTDALEFPRICRVCGSDTAQDWCDETLCRACEATAEHVVSRTNAAGGGHVAICKAPGCGWSARRRTTDEISAEIRGHWRQVVARQASPGTAVALADPAAGALAQITTPAEALDVAGKAEALRHYARATKDTRLYREAAEVQLRALRELGRFLSEIDRAGRGKSSKLEHLPTLPELGVTHKEAMQAQRIWAVPEAEFEARLPETVEQTIARAARGLNYMVKSVARPAAPAAPPPLPSGRYRAILADPPWRFETWSSAGQDRAPDMHYATMPLHEICALDIASLAADDCALFLWVYSPMLPDALRVIRDWGFDYKTIAFTWVKKANGQPEAPIGPGYWTRAQSEICLLATRGHPARADAGVRQVIEAPRQRHSAKPADQYERIERLVSGPYLELFARGTRPRWDRWGDQAPGCGSETTGQEDE